MKQLIADEIIKDPLIITKTFDPCQNMRHEFESIPFQEVKAWDNLIGLDDLHMLYDMETDSSQIFMNQISDVIMRDLKINREAKKVHGGKIPYWNIYCIEEAQDVIDSNSMRGKRGELWKKCISEGRNFNMSFIMIGQRLAEISTTATEKAQGYLIGKSSGDNDLSKIKRICGKKSGVSDIISLLNVGEFIYWDGVKPTKIKFPDYKTLATGKPWLVKPE